MAYLALVVATGSISDGAFLIGPSWLSRALLAAASARLAVLGTALADRLVFFRSSLTADIQAPDRVFGFFSITVGPDILGARLAPTGQGVLCRPIMAHHDRADRVVAADAEPEQEAEPDQHPERPGRRRAQRPAIMMAATSQYTRLRPAMSA